MDDLHQLIKAGGGKITILPGGEIPAHADWHLCTTQPIPNHVNYSATCSQCGCPVYFSDNNPTLKKICPACALANAKKNGGCENIGNFNSLTKAILHGRQN